MLNGKLALHEVKDVEALCGKVLSRSGLDLNPHEREALLTFLIESCWELSLRYERGRGSTTTFAGYATTILRSRVYDWLKHPDQLGRGYRPSLVSLDDRLAEAYTERAVDIEVDRSPDLMRALGAGGSSRARDERGMGEDAHVEAA